LNLDIQMNRSKLPRRVPWWLFVRSFPVKTPVNNLQQFDFQPIENRYFDYLLKKYQTFIQVWSWNTFKTMAQKGRAKKFRTDPIVTGFQLILHDNVG
jgi:hypothetical protein